MSQLEPEPEDLTVTRRASECLVRLPVYPEMTSEQQDRVILALKKALDRHA